MNEDSKFSFDEFLQLNLWEFYKECRHNNVPRLYIYEYIKRYSDGFNLEKLQMLFVELKPLIDMDCIEFHNDPERKKRVLEWGNLEFGILLESGELSGISALREILCNKLSDVKENGQCSMVTIRGRITKAQQVYVLDRLLG